MEGVRSKASSNPSVRQLGREEEHMTSIQHSKLESASGLNRPVRFRDKQTGKIEEWGTVVDEVFVIVGEETEDPYKHVIQKIRPAFDWGHHSEWFYRSGYYTFSAEDKERLVWGQYAQILTEREYVCLLAQARAKGWSLFQ
jgi:hypothetical protein